MNSEPKKYAIPPFDLIAAAVHGDAAAMQLLLKHYEQYINKLSLRKFYDEYGEEHYFVDEEIKGRLQIKLITKTLEFKLRKPER